MKRHGRPVMALRRGTARRGWDWYGMTETLSRAPGRRNLATVSLKAGPVRVDARARLSSAGLLAIGGLVSSILLSTSVLVWVATTPVRRRPLATRFARH